MAFVLDYESMQRRSSGIEREIRDVAGWKVHINVELLKSDTRKSTSDALRLLKKQLTEIVRDVPAPAVAELQKVPLYFSPEYTGKRGGLSFIREPSGSKTMDVTP